MRPELPVKPEGRQHGHDQQLALPHREHRASEDFPVAVGEDPLRQVGMEAPHPGNHAPVVRPVDPSAERLSPAPEPAGPPAGGRTVRGELLEHLKGVDGPAEPGEGNHLQERLVETLEGHANPECGADPAAEGRRASQGRRDRDAGQG